MVQTVLVVFKIADRLCALPREAVQEVLPLPTLSVPPGLPSVIAGILNLSGKAFPVVDLARLFGLPSASAADLYAHIILMRGSGDASPTALLTERVHDVMSFKGTMRPVDDGLTLNGCIAGEIEHGGHSVHVLAADRILMATEKEELEQLATAAQRRLDEWRATV